MAQESPLANEPEQNPFAEPSLRLGTELTVGIGGGALALFGVETGHYGLAAFGGALYFGSYVSNTLAVMEEHMGENPLKYQLPSSISRLIFRNNQEATE